MGDSNESDTSPILANESTMYCSEGVIGQQTTVSPVGPEDLPPPFYQGTQGGGVPMVTCQVCQAMIDISGERVGQRVAECGQCNEATFNTLTKALARCPHCRKVSSVGPDFARGRANKLLLLTISYLLSGIIVTAKTYSYSQKYHTVFLPYVGGFMLAIVMLICSLYYYFMKVSIIEGPM